MPGTTENEPVLPEHLHVIVGEVANPQSGERRDDRVERPRSLEIRCAKPEMIDRGFGVERRVVDGLDAVSVRIEEKRAVVVRLVVGSLARSPRVAQTSGTARVPERVDVRAARGHEADVETGRGGALVRRLMSESSPHSTNHSSA